MASDLCFKSDVAFIASHPLRCECGEEVRPLQAVECRQTAESALPLEVWLASFFITCEYIFSIFPCAAHHIHAIYTNSGSEANEVLIRTVRRYWPVLGKPEKTVMIGRWNGYHGSTLASTALGGMKLMHEMGGMIPDVAHID
jgi:hypothetical protein